MKIGVSYAKNPFLIKLTMILKSMKESDAKEPLLMEFDEEFILTI